ncbi:MAG TPA: hypothetical protein VL305_09015, partial [Pseudolabrys sp.]|nr:hypothetical protein [Pseudolabrys sp.]
MKAAMRRERASPSINSGVVSYIMVDAERANSMNTVKDALAQKSGALIHVRSGDMVVEALRQMRDNRVRSVLVIDD